MRSFSGPKYDLKRLRLPRGRRPGPVGLTVLGTMSLVIPFFARFLVSLERTPKLPGGPLVVVSNHRSVADGPLLFWACARAGRFVHLLSTAGPFTVPVLGQLMLTAGMIPVKRRTPLVRDALEDAVELVRGGGLVGLFPEGHVNSLPDEEVSDLRTGAARLALETGARVAVLTFSGSDTVVPPGSWKPRWGLPGHRVTTDLRMLDLSGLEALSRAEQVTTLTARIHEALGDGVASARARRLAR